MCKTGIRVLFTRGYVSSFYFLSWLATSVRAVYLCEVYLFPAVPGLALMICNGSP